MTSDPSETPADHNVNADPRGSMLNWRAPTDHWRDLRIPMPPIFDDLPLIESGQTSPFDSRNVNKHILTASRRLNKSISLCRIEPLHSTLGHYLLQSTFRRAAIVARSERKGCFAALLRAAKMR